MTWVYHETNLPNSMTAYEMSQNVDEIYAQFYSVYHWSVNAICGVLGNMQHESYLNPAQTQIGYPIGSASGGYGLCQWTPSTKLTNWLRANNHSLYSGFWQLYYLNFESGGTEYIPTSQFPETYAEFKVSGQTVAYLTECFLKNYERAGVEALSQRIQYAENWYRYLMGTDPPPEPTPTPPAPPDPPTPPDPDPSGYKGRTKMWLFLRSPRLRQ